MRPGIRAAPSFTYTGCLGVRGCFREDEEHRFKTKRSPVFSEILGEGEETQHESRAHETDLEIGQLKSALLACL